MKNKMATNKIINNIIFYHKAATLFKTISRSEDSTIKPSHNRIILINWLKEEVEVFPVMPKLILMQETNYNSNNKINREY